MNTLKFFAPSLIALASLGAGQAFADSIDRDYPITPAVASTVSRAQVREALAQARDGARFLTVRDSAYPVSTAIESTKTRNDVLVELAQARISGQKQEFRN